MVESGLRTKGILDNSVLSLLSIKLKGATYTITLYHFFWWQLIFTVTYVHLLLVINNILKDNAFISHRKSCFH